MVEFVECFIGCASPRFLSNWRFGCVRRSEGRTVKITYVYELGASASDGSSATGIVEWIDGTFYGTANGGPTGCGTIYRIAGGAGRTLTPFNCAMGGLNQSQDYHAALATGASGNLFGAAIEAVPEVNYSTVFSVSPSGTISSIAEIPPGAGNGLGALVSWAGLDEFYGTALFGGTGDCHLKGCGTVYQISSSGNYKRVADFRYNPERGLFGPSLPMGLTMVKDLRFYGTSARGGTGSCKGGCGTVFWVPPESGYTTIYSFPDAIGPWAPNGPLTLAKDGNLYGVASKGGDAAGDGAIFKIDTAGNYSVVAEFDGTNGSSPQGNMVEASDGNFYGMACEGGTAGKGTIFRMTPAGELTAVYNFSGLSNDASCPFGNLLQATNGQLYGSAEGGLYGLGVVFRLDLGLKPLPPIIRSFEPPEGPVGTSVYVRGARFVNVTSVEFGGVAAAATGVVSPSTIQVVVPPGAVSGPLTIVSTTGTAVSAGTFTVTN